MDVEVPIIKGNLTIKSSGFSITRIKVNIYINPRLFGKSRRFNNQKVELFNLNPMFNLCKSIV